MIKIIIENIKNESKQKQYIELSEQMLKLNHDISICFKYTINLLLLLTSV